MFSEAIPHSDDDNLNFVIVTFCCNLALLSDNKTIIG